MASHIGNNFRVELTDAQTNKMTDITEMIAHNWRPLRYVTRPQLGRLELMGFDPTERRQITDIALGMGQDPTDLGELIVRCRPMPVLCLKDLFIFSLHFDWRKAWLLTAVLALVAVVTG